MMLRVIWYRYRVKYCFNKRYGNKKAPEGAFLLNIHMKRLLILAILFWAQTLHAEPFEGWTKEEKSWFAAAEVFHVTDYLTTRNMLYAQQGYYEANPLLGPNPSPDRLNLWFAGWLIGNYFISDALSHEHRLLWLKIYTAIEVGATANNLYVGARITF